MKESVRTRSSITAVTILGLFLMGASAHAATRTMVGSLGVINPSVAPPFFFEVGPEIFGKKIGPYGPDTGWRTLDVAGTTPSTFVGRQVTLPANRLNFSGFVLRDFPAFPSVANNTKSYMSSHEDAVFAVGEGALAACPGNGCTFSSYTTTTGGVTNTVTVPGTAISWCPPTGEPAGTPSPGTPSNQVGDWNCASQQGAATGALNVRMSVSNVPGANHFGGTFTLLRNVNTSIWRVLVQPGEDGIAEVARSWQSLMTNQWPGGRSNFDFNLVGANVGPRINAYLAPNGAVSQTEGCVNPTGTVGVGKTFELGKLILGLGSNCGTPPTPKPPTSEWGFRLTTGDIEGSDPWPFVEVTTAAPPGTALLPNVKTRTPGQGFFFTRMGMDSTTGATRRNIVLVSGGVGRDPISGNLFFRITDLRMELLLPEPAMGLGLVVGAMALAALARRERR